MTLRRYWLAYDVSDNRERALVERCADRYGQRLQKSVFLCVLDEARFSALRTELAAMNCKTGTIALAALDGAHYTINSDGVIQEDESWVFGG